MNIEQKKYTNKTRFEFEPDQLKYTIQDKSGKKTFKTSYISIEVEPDELEEKNVWFRNVGIAWICIGLLIVGMSYINETELKFSIWIVLGVAFVLLYQISITKYSTMTSEKGTVFVIKDKKHDLILQEIDKRRKGEWLHRYGDLNLDNDPLNEIDKYRWLLDKSVISEDEYERSVSRIKEYHNLTSGGIEQSDATDGRTLN